MVTEYILCMDKPNTTLVFKSGRAAYRALRKIAHANKTPARVYHFDNGKSRMLWETNSRFEQNSYMLEVQDTTCWNNPTITWYKWSNRESVFSNYNDFLRKNGVGWRIYRVNHDWVGIPIQGNI